jgi:hypothetical protein
MYRESTETEAQEAIDPALAGVEFSEAPVAAVHFFRVSLTTLRTRFKMFEEVQTEWTEFGSHSPVLLVSLRKYPLRVELSSPHNFCACP